MNTLKIQITQMIQVSDWDYFVMEVYGRPYSLQQQGGCRNRSTVYITASPEVPEEYNSYTDRDIPEELNSSEMGVTFKRWLARDPKKPLSKEEPLNWQLQMWWERNFYPDVDVVANDLCKRGLLPPGKYTIEINW